MTVREVWMCPGCGWVYESPIRVNAMSCAKRHTRRAMGRVWSKDDDGGSPPSFDEEEESYA